MAKVKNNPDADAEYERKLQEYHDNRVAFYSNWVAAWIENRMEVDKHLLTLSALGIGLLVGVFNDSKNIYQFATWFFSGLSFFLCIVTILIIFNRNSSYIEFVLKNHQAGDVDDNALLKKEKEKEDKQSKCLNGLTIAAFSLFSLGAFLTIALAVMRSDICNFIRSF